ncbi:putative membrane protein YkoI [Streptosporangium becharense]|uniref:Putative membrane protein YkoI n=1 Tax=Streptosporangium becharense TaxID=1816182 RepID=A0A7W9IDI7_9ACTN|nr:PepSY domain-containing protein [Streptosporangium becharense]MBB2912202.1 putative membrane protein YkoI [Streptosporangium becharense]MBB5818749.1 putative membrane protein YkoI [Streptosporangium becharense]
MSLGAAALLAGGGGPAFAAAQTAQTAADAAGTTGATTGTTTAGSATGTSATAGISSRRAVQIAEKRVPGARVTDVDREWERGHRTWKVELEKGRWEYEVHVSVKNGKVVAFERDYED